MLGVLREKQPGVLRGSNLGVLEISFCTQRQKNNQSLSVLGCECFPAASWARPLGLSGRGFAAPQDSRTQPRSSTLPENQESACSAPHLPGSKASHTRTEKMVALTNLGTSTGRLPPCQEEAWGLPCTEERTPQALSGTDTPCQPA